MSKLKKYLIYLVSMYFYIILNILPFFYFIYYSWKDKNRNKVKTCECLFNFSAVYLFSDSLIRYFRDGLFILSYFPFPYEYEYSN